VQSVNLGYNRENLVYIPLEGDLTGKYKLFKAGGDAAAGGWSGVSRASQSPTNIENGTLGVDWDGKDPNNTIMFTNTSAGYDFVKTMGLQLTEGRDYSPAYGTDTVGYILNEEAAKRIGYKDPIGQRLTFWGKKGNDHRGGPELPFQFAS
jgi:putative ABC transport system permease protein